MARGVTELNQTIAKLFLEIADMLAVKRANPHRIKAYRRAAETLLTLPEDVAATAKRGELQKVPGIGRALSAKIQGFLETGTVRSYEDLKSPLPPDIATWSRLPGLSESAVQHLYFRLGIRTLDDLETLTRSHLLRTLPGVTASEEDLLAAIRVSRGACQ